MTKLRLTKEGQEMISKWQKEEIAALRAQNAELREALKALSSQFDERGYPANTHANVKTTLLDARAILAKYGSENV